MSNFSPDFQEALWWRSSQPHEPPGANHHRQAWPSNPYPYYHHHHDRGLGLNLNQRGEDDESSEVEEQVVDEMNATNYAGEQEVPELDKELLFEKPLTPSDVGKLNRLVIPKQHAEKCFPLGGESGDKGLLLSFEDESGRCWRFRYSYWSSSQSYVLTKGWSKYVKEKRLDAGDVILFGRHRVDMDRLFIGWRRRGEEPVPLAQPRGWTVTAATYPTKRGFCHSYPAHHPGHDPHSGSAALNRTAVTGNSRTLRLFGVNMECWLDKSEPSMPDGSSLSSLGLGHQPIYSQPSHQMDITFTQDANYRHIRDRRG